MLRQDNVLSYLRKPCTLYLLLRVLLPITRFAKELLFRLRKQERYVLGSSTPLSLEPHSQLPRTLLRHASFPYIPWLTRGYKCGLRLGLPLLTRTLNPSFSITPLYQPPPQAFCVMPFFLVDHGEGIVGAGDVAINALSYVPGMQKNFSEQCCHIYRGKIQE